MRKWVFGGLVVALMACGDADVAEPDADMNVGDAEFADAARADGAAQDADIPMLGDATFQDADRLDGGSSDAGDPDAGDPDAGDRDAAELDATLMDAAIFDGQPADAAEQDAALSDADLFDSALQDGASLDSPIEDGGSDGGEDAATSSGPGAPFIVSVTLSPERINRLESTDVEVVAFDPDDRDATLNVTIVDHLDETLVYGTATKLPAPRRDAYRLTINWSNVRRGGIRTEARLRAVARDADDDFATSVVRLELASEPATCFGEATDIANDDNNCGGCGIGCHVVRLRGTDQGICVDGECTPTLSECLEIRGISQDNCTEYCASIGLSCATTARGMAVAQAYYEFAPRCEAAEFPISSSGSCGRDFGNGFAIPYVRCVCTQQ